MRYGRLLSSALLIAASSAQATNSTFFYGETDYLMSPRLMVGSSQGGDAIENSRTGLTLNSADGLFTGFGLEIAKSESPYSVKLYGAYFMGGASEDKAKIDLTRFEVGAVPSFYITEKLSVGAGVNFYLSGELTNQTSKWIKTQSYLENAMGFVFESEYHVFDSLSVTARYTVIEMEDELQSISFNSDNFAVVVNWKL
jgi:hypothetical protein